MRGLEYSRHTVSSCGLCVYVQALIFDRKTHREVLLDINTLFTASKRLFPLIFKIFRFPGSKAPNRPEISGKIGNFQLDRMWTSPGPRESYCEDGMLKFDPICPRARWDMNMAECQAPCHDRRAKRDQAWSGRIDKDAKGTPCIPKSSETCHNLSNT